MRHEQITYSPRMAGLVKRYHTWPTHQTQSVAEHSWQVYRIYERLFGVPSSDVAHYIVWHDAGETATGDIPFGVKARDPELKVKFDALEGAALARMGVVPSAISDEQRRRVKLCDVLEMWEFGQHEVALGNRLAQPVVDVTSVLIWRLADHILEDGVCHKINEFMKETTTWTT